MPDRSAQSVSLARLEDAVARGIISAAQLHQILEESRPTTDSVPPDSSGEFVRGLNAVMIAYYVGAAAVVFAFGWYIVDRWDTLGPTGVLIVSVLYAALFGLASRTIARLGYHAAASLLALLAVVMTPLAVWGVLHLTGLWYEPHSTLRYWYGADILAYWRWIPLELATALAALVTLRRVHFAVLALPVAVALPLVIGHAMPMVMDPEIVSAMSNWMLLVSASMLLACGYWVDRHPRDNEDYARWVYLCSLITLTVGIGSVWSDAGYLRHGLVGVALGLFALSLYLKRPMFVVFGAIAFLSYLEFLAFDVFRATLGFPIVLATFGTCAILITVWLQQRYPALARRMDARQQGARTVPHARLVFGGAGLVMCVLFAAQLPAAHARAENTWAEVRRGALNLHRMEKRQKANAAKLHGQRPATRLPPRANR